MEPASRVSVSGHLFVYPFGSTDRSSCVADHYTRLRESYDTEEILCLTRLCSEQDITEKITDQVTSVEYPTVETLEKCAKRTLHELIPNLQVLSDHERIELLAAFLQEHDWDHEYLSTAAAQSSFQQDVGQLLIEMESREALTADAYDSPVLREIASVGNEFQSLLTEREYVDNPSLIPRAIAELTAVESENDVPPSITQWETILVADYEEFGPTERRLIRLFADRSGASITGIAEKQSRLLSSWREAGDVGDTATGLEVQPQTPEQDTVAAPDAVGQYLVTNERPAQNVAEGTVQVIESPTFREQLTEVADEIEQLCRSAEYTYEDITIAYQDSKAPVEQTIRLLRRQGIPTTTVTGAQLGNDPAIRELYDVAKVAVPVTSDTTTQETSRERLLSLETADANLLAEIQEAPTVAAGLWHWLSATQLKDRIGKRWGDIEAQNQFQRVRDVIALAEFLDSEPNLAGTWDGFLKALERAFKYSSARLENIETDHTEGGVTVGTIYGLKHASYKAVFLPNVTDQDYPFTPSLTALLPRQRLRTEQHFPMLTTQTPADVAETFAPADGTDDDPFEAYFSQVSRRLLGVGACTATERLYFGVPREGVDSLSTYHQPSRFLTELVETFDLIDPLDSDEETQIASHGGASEFVVEHVDETLEAVRRASVGGETVALDTYERELAAIERTLDQPEAATVRDALEARIEFRHGRVRRD